MMEEKEIRITASQLAQAYEGERAKMDAVRSRIDMISGTQREAEVALMALDSMEKAQEGCKIKVSLGAGIYADAAITNPKEVGLVLVGNVMMPASIEKARNEMKKRKDDLARGLEAARKEQQRVATNMEGLARIIRSAKRAPAR